MLKKILIGLGIVAVLLFIAFQYMSSQTKKASPEVKNSYTVGTAKVDVFYCSPSKKGREIFGKLIPYGEVWRTGANEASTIETDKELTVGGQKLPAGKYSLWTIPNQDAWTVIFNKDVPSWGVSWGGKASRDEAQDALKVPATVETLTSAQEKLDISVQNGALSVSWDNVKASVPVTAQ